MPRCHPDLNRKRSVSSTGPRKFSSILRYTINLRQQRQGHPSLHHQTSLPHCQRRHYPQPLAQAEDSLHPNTPRHISRISSLDGVVAGIQPSLCHRYPHSIGHRIVVIKRELPPILSCTVVASEGLRKEYTREARAEAGSRLKVEEIPEQLLFNVRLSCSGSVHKHSL